MPALQSLLTILLLYVTKSHQLQTEANQPNLLSGNARTAKPLFRDAGRGGIAHIRLASEKLGNHLDSVMLHIFLRAIQLDHRLLIKGFGKYVRACWKGSVGVSEAHMAEFSCNACLQDLWSP